MDSSVTKVGMSISNLLNARLDTSKAMKAIMEKLDTNKDGAISEQEVMAAALKSKNASNNGDGSGLNGIFGDSQTQTEQAQSDESENDLPKNAEELFAKIIKELDTNGDGIISLDEINAAREKAKQVLENSANSKQEVTIDQLIKSIVLQQEAGKASAVNSYNQSTTVENENSDLNIET
jgi:Ca2+-binding EF-hand superfamily protein